MAELKADPICNRPHFGKGSLEKNTHIKNISTIKLHDHQLMTTGGCIPRIIFMSNDFAGQFEKKLLHTNVKCLVLCVHQQEILLIKASVFAFLLKIRKI